MIFDDIITIKESFSFQFKNSYLLNSLNNMSTLSTFWVKINGSKDKNVIQIKWGYKQRNKRNKIQTNKRDINKQKWGFMSFVAIMKCQI